MKTKRGHWMIVSLLLAVAAGMLLSPAGIRVAEGQVGSEWRVWMKTSPCSINRFDWVAVSNQNPTGPPNFFVQFPGSQTWTTFAAAMAQANALRVAPCTFGRGETPLCPKFANYCCRNWEVWKNEQTKQYSVVPSPHGNPGGNLYFEKGQLCCDEAAAWAGLPETFCGGGGAGSGYLGCYRDSNNPFDLDGYLERSLTSNTPQRCIQICRQKGFAFAGVQYGQSCLCGNSYGNQGRADNCNYHCTGDPGQTCGGSNANSVYFTGAAGGGTTSQTGQQGVDLSGVWHANIVESNTGYNFAYGMTLSRIAANKWKGPFTLTVTQAPSLGFNTEVTVEALDGSRMRMTYSAQGRMQEGTGTYTRDRIAFGGPQNTVVFARK